MTRRDGGGDVRCGEHAVPIFVLLETNELINDYAITLDKTADEGNFE